MIVRTARPDDLEDYLKLQESSWGDDMKVDEEKARHRFRTCLDYILMAVSDDGLALGTTTMIRLPEYNFSQPLTWQQATGDGWCDTHADDGKIFFGVDLSVAKSVSGFGVVDALMSACMGLVISAGVKYCIWGGRMPRYHRYAARYPDPDIYAKTKRGQRYLDPQIQMYSEIPFNRLIGVIPGYFNDPESLDNGVLWRWRNPFYRLPYPKFWASLVPRLYSVQQDWQTKRHPRKSHNTSSQRQQGPS